MKVILKQQEANNEIVSLSEAVPEALMHEATRKIRELKQFDADIAAEMEDLIRRSKRLKEKFRVKLYEERNLGGFLTHSLESYQSCIGETDQLQIQALMQEDLKHWETAFAETEKNRATQMLEIKAILEE